MNGSFGFSHPWVLAFLAVIIPLVLYDFAGGSRKREGRLPKKLKRKLLISAFFFKIFIACVIIAIAGPHWGRPVAVTDNRRGLDAVFAIDVSNSMDIRDVSPTGGAAGAPGGIDVSRLERGLAIAKETIHTVPGLRYAVAIGKGSAILTIPLTWDAEAVLNFLEAVSTSSMTSRGTNLEALVMAATTAFHTSFMARQVIILVSDGEELSGAINNALDYSQRNGISVLAVAVGSDEGRPVSEIGLLYPGVISSRNAAVMRQAARQTGGIYIDGNRDDAAAILAAHLRSLASPGGFGDGSSGPRERRSLFIIIAFIAYIASKFSPMLTRGGKR